MPKLEYFVICESLSVDQETNRVSLFNIIEEIQLLPVGTEGGYVLAHMVAVSCWNRETEDEGKDFQVILRIHVTGAEIKDFPMNFQMERSRQRLLMRIQGPPPLQPGVLRFELLLNGRHAAEHIVHVHAVPGTTAGSSQ